MLDQWLERVVKLTLKGVAYLVRYLDDFVMGFQYRADTFGSLCNRRGKFSLTLETTKTKLVEFSRVAQRPAGKHGRKPAERIIFWALRCIARNQKGNFRIGMRTEGRDYGVHFCAYRT
jgi:RNA-directed DNA polymerase